MKLSLKQIAIVITILSVAVSIFSNVQTIKHKAESERLSNNLYSKTIEYEDDLGRKVTEVTQLDIKVSEFKSVMKKDSTKLNEYEKIIFEMGKELKASGRKLKDVEAILNVTVETTDEMAMQTRDTFYRQMEAKTAHFSNDLAEYDITYIPELDSLKLAVVQRYDLYIDLFREREKNSKGKDVFILWRWTKDWKYKGSIKTTNNAAIIKDFTIININKR